MSDPHTAADMDVRKSRDGLSWVWIVPVIALIVSLSVAWQTYSQRGTLIDIIFQSASGVRAGETVLRFRDVEVGTVEKVAFDEGLTDVIVSVRVDNEVAPYLDDDAQFWVVQPDVSLRGVTGLETVLSGVFIEGTWDGSADVAQTEFFGMDSAPLTTLDQLGTAITLRTRDGSALSKGAPILHRGIRVGTLETPRLSANGESVIVDGFVDFPYDRILTTATRFWDTSGFSLSLGAGGVELDVNSIASLIEGGVAFDTVVSGGERVSQGYVFDIFEDEEIARNSVFVSPNTPTVEIAVLFDDSVSGLTKGSEVRFQGIRIGQVADLSAIINEMDGEADVQLQAILSLETNRIGMDADTTEGEALQFLADYVENGLRARLSTANILSGALIVELIEEENATPATLDIDADPFPIIPTADAAIADVAETAEEVLARIERLPIEELLQGAIDLMASIERLANDESVRDVPEELASLLQETRALVSSEDVQGIPPDIRDAIGDFDGLVQSFVAAELATQLTEALTVTTEAASNISDGTENLSEISVALEDLLTKVNALELAALVTEATSTLDSIDTLIESDETQALPASLNETLADARAVLVEAERFMASEDLQALPSDLRTTVADLNAILAQIQAAELVLKLDDAITSAAAAANSIETASADLPAITAELQSLAEKANALKVEELIEEATQTLASIDALLGAVGVDELPENLNLSLAEFRDILSDLRTGGAVENLNSALSSASGAAEALEDATVDLPDLIARANALVRESREVVESYSSRSRFGAEALTTLQGIQDAADAISALARTIQRNPSSLIRGR